jgi:hypothetical protein
MGTEVKLIGYSEAGGRGWAVRSGPGWLGSLGGQRLAGLAGGEAGANHFKVRTCKIHFAFYYWKFLHRANIY